MLLFSSLHRELGNFRVKWNLDKIVKNFACHKLDEHRIESFIQEGVSRGDTGNFSPPLACQFSRANPNYYAVADESGGIMIKDATKLGRKSLVHEWWAHTDNAVFDVDWSVTGNELLTSSGDQTVALWDVKKESKIAGFSGHTSSVRSVNFRPTDVNIFASCARDGHIMIWDKRKKPNSKEAAHSTVIQNFKGKSSSYVSVLRNAHQTVKSTVKRRNCKLSEAQENNQSVTAVLFQDEQSLLSAGTHDGIVKVWDLRKLHGSNSNEQSCRNAINFKEHVRKCGLSSLTLDCTKTRLFANCKDGFIYQFDCLNYSGKPVCRYGGQLNGSYYVRCSLSPCGQYLLSGSADPENNAYIWRVDSPQTSPSLLQGHCGEVGDVAWSPRDLQTLVTTSDDGTCRVWRWWDFVDVLPEQHKSDLVGLTKVKSAEKYTACTPRKATPASTSHLLLSPSRGRSVAPFSPRNALSPSAKRALAEITGSTNKRTPSTILQWIQPEKPPIHLQSPQKTPRKLTITPMKENRTPRSSVKSPLMTSPLQNRNGNQMSGMTSPRRGVKRKLCVDNIVQSPLRLKQCLSPKISKSLNSILSATPFDSINIGENKSAMQNFASPTADLPNYVTRPDARTPRAATPSRAGARTRDWLSKLRNQKSTEDESLLSPPKNPHKQNTTGAADASLTSPASAKKQPCDKTPAKGRKRAAKNASKTPLKTETTPAKKKRKKNPETPGSSQNSEDSNVQESTENTPSVTSRKRTGSILKYFSKQTDK